MTNPLENDYKALHAAAITLSTKMLATLQQNELDLVARTTSQGAKLMMQFALPDCAQVELVLVELEGKRTPVCRLGKSPININDPLVSN